MNLLHKHEPVHIAPEEFTIRGIVVLPTQIVHRLPIYKLWARPVVSPGLIIDLDGVGLRAAHKRFNNFRAPHSASPIRPVIPGRIQTEVPEESRTLYGFHPRSNVDVTFAYTPAFNGNSHQHPIKVIKILLRPPNKTAA